MIRILIFLLAVSAFAVGLHWLADRPGTIVVEWQDYVAETSVILAVVLLLLLVALLLLVWSALRQVWASPAAVGRLMRRRRLQRGLDAISGGIIAIGAGDGSLATRYALQARKSLPHEPLTHLLRAQAAQLNGDASTARRIFEAMLATPDTAQLGLRGLFLEAMREGETEPARQFAERALKLNPKLAWPVEALFDLMCKAQDWPGALATLAVAQRQNLIDKAVAQRRRAVVLTAKAQEAEDTEPDRALEFALEAHKLAPNLVPAAAIAGRILASQGNTPRAARVLLKTWRLAPHPELATVYAYARPGDSPRDRLTRVRHLGRLTPQDNEAAIAIAIASIETREWDEARKVLEPLLGTRLTQRVCTLMARIEGEQYGNAGGVREWLARAVNAPRDPAWTADGIVSDVWAPTSPVTGALDAFRWRVPVEPIDAEGGALLAAKVEALVGLGAGPPSQLTANASAQPIAAPSEPASIDASEGTAPPVPRKSPAFEAPAAAAARSSQAGAGEPETERRAPLRTNSAGPSVRAAATPRSRARPAAEPRIFVPPPAPDDPGAGATADEEVLVPELRGSAAKA
ncbi:MAG TPA: heme biosynthesis HemY N-terminal domain-containing protein [Hyphomicrobiaceae bacterium]|nr:heme biosynthesis HemY N-terminal domain-containing protein [Hyphomicrobiaceae bacterium]